MHKRKHFRRGILGDTISYTYLTILALLAAFPLFWILVSSVKSKGELTANPTAIFPQVFSLEYYKIVFEQLKFGTNIMNSVVVAGSTTIIAILISALGAYGVVRFFPRFGKIMTRVLITTYMFPPILLAIPYSIIMGKAGLVNSRVGLIIVYLSISVPYAIWLLVGFFQTVPLEIEEAAYMDGANKLQVFSRVVLPICNFLHADPEAHCWRFGTGLYQIKGDIVMKTIGYAIVGTGYFGAELGRIMKEQEGAKIVAVYDPENAETVAKELGCDVETDLDKLCSRDDVDAVLVASPNYLHKEPVLTAARHKKHVFCEKPIALCYADCDEMVRACKENGVIFMAGHVMNFFRAVRHTKRLIAEGKIGRVLYCHSARNGWEEPQPSISWKKIRAKSGGHLYHHIHELDCIQFLMGPATEVTMTGGNVAHKGEQFGDEDDMLFLLLEFGNGTYAVVEYGSAFHYPEHYVLIQGTNGYIKIDMCNVGMTVKTADGEEEHYLVHETKEEDDQRTQIYHSTEMDGAIQYGHPGKKPPLWLHGIMKNEMKFFNGIMHGDPVTDEFRPLLTGEAARAAIASADAATKSLREDRKVKVSEITG